MFNRIRWRIAVPYIVLIALAMVLLTTYILQVGRATYLEDLIGRLSSEARLLAGRIDDSLSAQSEGALREMIGREANQLGVRVTVIAADGRVVADSARDAETMDNHLYRAEVREAMATGQGAEVRYSQTVGYDTVYVAVPFRQGAALAGVVRVAVPLSELNATMGRLWRDTRVGVVLGVLSALLLAVWIAESTLRPVRSLTQVVQRMAQGDLRAHLIPPTRDEIGELTRSFNEMAARLSDSLDALDDERAQLAAVLDNMADGVLIIDNEGFVRLANPAAARILDVPAEEMIARSLAQVVRRHEIIAVWENYRQGAGEHVELVEVERERLFLQVVVTPLGSAGAEVSAEPHAFLVMLQDLRHIRQLETVRREFVSNISHELRTPLASLKALSDTLRDGALEDTERAIHFLERIDHEVDALTQMTQELSELTRLESGQAPLRLVPTDLAEVIPPAVERLRPQAERAGLQLEVTLQEGLPRVLGDRERLRQVVTNLVHNAIKFTPQGGHVRVAAAEEAGEVVVSVADTGIGIPDDVLTRIFERFYKRDRSRSEEGMGLGLAIAKHVVQGHGGRIWVESTEGRGSVFSFTLLRAHDAYGPPERIPTD
ncbi:MAG: HAMP domain-containing protein [Anaerolineae bacterium]|nr:HAMP domain-containing protein [Anaerolineae bacterium]